MTTLVANTQQIIDTLARLRIAREVHPAHEVIPGQPHTGCDICTSEKRLDWLLSQIPVAQPRSTQPQGTTP